MIYNFHLAGLYVADDGLSRSHHLIRHRAPIRKRGDKTIFGPMPAPETSGRTAVPSHTAKIIFSDKCADLFSHAFVALPVDGNGLARHDDFPAEHAANEEILELLKSTARTTHLYNEQAIALIEEITRNSKRSFPLIKRNFRFVWRIVATASVANRRPRNFFI